ncbi:Uncharacterised protein [Mycobacteroides abscessus subsp. abscessus]|nr:Uncharacterised protein [Mycobacteroides abscessus subsp. abscessus]
MRCTPPTARSPSINCSRRFRIPSRYSLSTVRRHTSAAAAIPSAPGTFSVPARNRFSCGPPRVTGSSRCPLRTSNAPIPRGPPNLCADTDIMVAPTTVRSNFPAVWTASVWKATPDCLAISAISQTG